MKRNLSGRIFVCVLSLVMLIEQTGIVSAKPFSSLTNFDPAELSLDLIEQPSKTEFDALPISPEEDNLPSPSSEFSDEEKSDNRNINPDISISSGKLAQHEAEKVILEVNDFSPNSSLP